MGFLDKLKGKLSASSDDFEPTTHGDDYVEITPDSGTEKHSKIIILSNSIKIVV